MGKKYTREQFWQLYEKLPQELKDALSAEETGDSIYDACQKNGILGNLDSVVECVGQVLVGVLPPEEFQEALEKELKLKRGVAKKVSREINRFIFYPVKSSLEELYRIEITVPIPTQVTPRPKADSRVEEKPSAPPRKDTYREPVE